MSGDKERPQRQHGDHEEPAGQRSGSQTRSSQIPAAIRAYSHTEELPTVRLSAPTGRPVQLTVTTGVATLTSPNQRTPQSSPKAVLLAYLQQMEKADTPTRFSAGALSFVASQGRISPYVQGGGPLAEPADQQTPRRAHILRIWNALGELALQETPLIASPLAPDDAAGKWSNEWLHPVEFCFCRSATSAPRYLPLLQSLREQIEGNRAISILFQRERDQHPLFRVHDVAGAEQLTLHELDTWIRYGETMSRQLAALAGAAVPGANHWFGLQEEYAAMVLSVQDLTLVSLFGLERLGRFVGLAESLETAMRTVD